jgi:hypothetical protein
MELVSWHFALTAIFMQAVPELPDTVADVVVSADEEAPIPIRRWSFCVRAKAERFSMQSNELAEVILSAAYGACAPMELKMRSQMEAVYREYGYPDPGATAAEEIAAVRQRDREWMLAAIFNARVPESEPEVPELPKD